MLRLLLAAAAIVPLAFAAAALVGDNIYLLMLVSVPLMLVVAAIAPDVFVRGEWPKPRRR